jgi:hypothetical protein
LIWPLIALNIICFERQPDNSAGIAAEPVEVNSGSKGSNVTLGTSRLWLDHVSFLGRAKDREFNKTQNLILESMTEPHFPKLKIRF